MVRMLANLLEAFFLTGRQTDRQTNMKALLYPIVLCGQTPFHMEGRGLGHGPTAVFPRTVECGSNHSTLFSHMLPEAEEFKSDWRVYLHEA